MMVGRRGARYRSAGATPPSRRRSGYRSVGAWPPSRQRSGYRSVGARPPGRRRSGYRSVGASAVDWHGAGACAFWTRLLHLRRRQNISAAGNFMVFRRIALLVLGLGLLSPAVMACFHGEVSPDDDSVESVDRSEWSAERVLPGRWGRGVVVACTGDGQSKLPTNLRCATKGKKRSMM